MKKLLLSALCVACLSGSMVAENQKALTGTKFRDNWSIGLNAGVTQTLGHPYSIGDNIRPIVGVDVYKQFTPLFSN